MANNSGIYTITNLTNNKIYVGYSTNLYSRKYEHFGLLKKNKHGNKYLQNAVSKYGLENFKYEVLEECEIQFLCALEHYWATLLRTHEEEFGYNLRPTHPYNPAPKGYRFKLSEKDLQWRRDNYKLDIHRLKTNKENIKLAQKSNIGKKYSDQHKKNLTKGKLGYNRKIEIFFKNGNLFKECDFLSEAEELTNVKGSAIRNNLYKLSKFAGNFIFKHKILDNE